MHDIAMLIQCPERRCEIQPGERALTECLIEELISCVLSTLFQVVLIEDVSLVLPATPVHQETQITLSLHALGYEPLSTIAPNLFDYVVEDRLSCALIELFGSLHVQRFAVC